MAGLTEERLRVVAIIHALKAVGIRVKNWKNFLNANSNSEQTFIEVTVTFITNSTLRETQTSLIYLEYSSQKNGPQRFIFGRDLHLLPQQQLSEMGGTVPQ